MKSFMLSGGHGLRNSIYLYSTANNVPADDMVCFTDETKFAFLSYLLDQSMCLLKHLRCSIFLVLRLPRSYTFVMFSRFRIRKHRGVIALFHPYCNAGGGGERVLWCAINAMQKKYSGKYRYVVYTGDVDVTPQKILQKAKDCFDIQVIDTNLQFIYLRTRSWLKSSNYPYFTLLFQNLAGFLVGVEALCRYNPHVFIDTMGYPFTLPLFRWLAGCNVACYVHYPVISTGQFYFDLYCLVNILPFNVKFGNDLEMIKLVGSAEPSYNNAQWITKSRLFTYLNWTRDHIAALWGVDDCAYLVYPPCDVDNLLRINSRAEELLREAKLVQILSIGQIRPEKDHRLQICFLAELKKRLLKENLNCKIRLVICGGCRDVGDVQRAKDLQRYAEDMGLSSDDLEWALNASVDKVATLLEESLIGIHTMQNEHFGISVVEGIAAGQIMIAHNSGGPKLDILNADAMGSKTSFGLLAASVNVNLNLKEGWKAQHTNKRLLIMGNFVDSAIEIIRMSPEQRNSIRDAARSSVNRFSEKNFEKGWNSAIDKLLPAYD
ncbi:unnamed protein product [Litomosoides sigmodontis]|uniref:GDP-Man:Man(3)GlcNAc(2)-PP-Dol alpha-1,2-mannosyltransferase n=1 Tax=Litomosoides sigmodontis TaxID=42156 RepID=A0A3P6U7M7_LITSI|nr:unnamed protein product [Litomosoides sigmodontis]